MEPLIHFAIAAVLAAGAALAAAQHATARRPRWAALTVLLAVVAVAWGTYAAMATVADGLVWRLELLRQQTAP